MKTDTAQQTQLLCTVKKQAGARGVGEEARSEENWKLRGKRKTQVVRLQTEHLWL